MTADADRAREMQMDDERLAEWVEAKIARLSAVYEPPWNDPAPDGEKISGETAAS